MVELESNSCRICLTITQQNERQQLISEDRTLSDVGLLYEDVLRLPISLEYITLKYICNSCDLQLKLFNQLTQKALETYLLLEDIVKLTDEDIIKNGVISEYNEDVKPEIIEEINENEDSNDVHESELIECENKEEIDEAEDIQYLDEEGVTENDDDTQEVQDEEYLSETNIAKSYTPSESSSIPMETYECSECYETNHKKKIHPKTKRYRCNLCPKTMYSEEALEVHLNIHKGLPAYQCNLCDKTFKQKNHYNYHMLNHRNERNIICDICQKGFLGKSDLRIHMRVHTDERRYTCDICDKKFRAHTHMINHRYSHFEKQFECPMCQQKYVSPNTLKTHIKSVHIGEVPHECELCEKKFKRKHHLIAHYKTHNKGVETLVVHDQT